MITLNAHIQLEKKLNDVWERENPILLNGELVAVETEDGIKFKVGDGKTPYRRLSFANICNPVEVNVPTKISELENDANYISYNENRNCLTLPNAATISTSDCLYLNTNMEMVLKADVLNLGAYGDSASITFVNSDCGRINGDVHVQEPVTDESIVNKAYVDRLITELREIIPNR